MINITVLSIIIVSLHGYDKTPTGVGDGEQSHSGPIRWAPYHWASVQLLEINETAQLFSE